MTSLSEERKREITAALRDRGVTLSCPCCGSERLDLLDGYIMEFTQSQLRNMVVGSANRFVTVASVCGRCGFLAQHALEPLGLAIWEEPAGECPGKVQQVFH